MRNILLIFCLFICWNCAAIADILNVPEEYTLIQSAVNNAAPSDTVLIAPGIYEENIAIEGFPLTLAGYFILGEEYSETPEQTIIDGFNLDFNTQPLLHISNALSDTFRITGLSFYNGFNYSPDVLTEGGAIYADTSLLNINNCNFNMNSAAFGGAVCITSCITHINDCYFNNNSAYAGGGIVQVYDNLYLEDSYFEGNYSATGGYGGGAVATDHECNGFIRNNHFLGNFAYHFGGTLYLKRGHWEIDNNIFEANYTTITGGAITCGHCDSVKVRNNIFLFNEAVDNTSSSGGAIFLSDSDTKPSIVEKNTFIGNFAQNSGSAAYNSDDSTFFRDNMMVGNSGRFCGTLLTVDVNGVYPTVFYNNNAVKFTIHDSLSIWTYSAAIVTSYGAISYFEENDFINNCICTAEDNAGGVSYLENNYWGDETGPMHPTQNPDGLGDVVSEDLDIIPFATEPFWEYGLEFDTTVYDFGYVAPGESSTHNFTLTNVSGQDLQIFKLLIVIDYPGFSVPPMDSLYIIAGESITVPVTFAPEVETNYYNILSTAAFDHRASGTTLELLGSGIDTGVDSENGLIPTSFSLSNPRPNPFNGVTVFSLFLPRPGYVQIKVYDINGREVMDFGDRYLNRGELPLQVDLNNHSSGIYFLNLQYEKQLYTRKLLLMK